MRWRIGEELGDGRVFAASADRNKDPILAVLERELPPSGLVLEIGSGTGQHVSHFARALPRLSWQPSDVDAALRRSVSAWVEHERLHNVREPISLDVRRRPWPVAAADALVCINVLHVAPWATTLALFDGAQEVLPARAPLFLYGPYRRHGRHTATSNERFDGELRAFDPHWGLRDVERVSKAGRRAGFALTRVVDMPANNFSLLFRRADSAAV